MQLSKLNPFRKPDASVIARRELSEYRRHLITHQEAAEYSHKMAEFYKDGIVRLTEHTYPS